MAGYAGGELARLLLNHPEVSLTYVASETCAGQLLASAQPGTARRSELICEKYSKSEVTQRCDIAFLAQESGFAMKCAAALLEAGKRIIDLSADFRLKNAQTYKTWYKNDHDSPNYSEKAVYGLPELNKSEIVNARLVANPGCYPTAAILAVAPLLADGLIDPKTIVINSLSGVSGAGRSKQRSNITSRS